LSALQLSSASRKPSITNAASFCVAQIGGFAGASVGNKTDSGTVTSFSGTISRVDGRLEQPVKLAAKNRGNRAVVFRRCM
jgi:hypothetical protein